MSVWSVCAPSFWNVDKISQAAAPATIASRSIDHGSVDALWLRGSRIRLTRFRWSSSRTNRQRLISMNKRGWHVRSVRRLIGVLIFPGMVVEL